MKRALFSSLPVGRLPVTLHKCTLDICSKPDLRYHIPWNLDWVRPKTSAFDVKACLDGCCAPKIHSVRHVIAFVLPLYVAAVSISAHAVLNRPRNYL